MLHCHLSILSGQYGVAIAAVGMISTLGGTVSAVAYGPIAENACGIAKMAELDERIIQITESLDTLGTSTVAKGKGFATGSAILTSLSILSAFQHKAKIGSIDLADAYVMSSALFGAMLPFLFSSLTMLSVQKVS